MSKILKTSCAALLVGVLGCRNETIAPFNPRAIQQSERSGAVGAPMPQARPLPTTMESDSDTFDAGTRRTGLPPATGPAIGTNESVIRMPLHDVVQRAVANSLDVRVAGYTPAIEQTRVIEAEARFDPTFFTNVTYSDQTTLAPSVENLFVPTNNAITFKSVGAQIGMRQDLESGGRVELRYQPQRTRRFPKDVLSVLDPFYTSNLTLQVTQPLLRDFGTDVNRARIDIAKNNQRIGLLDFRKQLEETIADVERTFWQLSQAMDEVRVAEELLDRTLRTTELLSARREQDVTRVQISQATASLEERRTILIRARARVRDLSDQLKRLMNDPDLPVTNNTLVLPGDPPLQEQIRFSLEDQITSAMEHRMELGQQQLRVDSAGVAANVAKNNLNPQLNFVGSIGVEGLGQTYSDAVDAQDDLDAVSYSVGLQLEIPLGNRAARAIWRRAQLQRLQAMDQYRLLVEQVAMEVKIAFREVDTTWTEMVGTRRSRFSAADALLAVEQREAQNEALTPEFVNRKLDLQERLARAEQSEAQAVANYNIALSRLELSKGTLLRYNNIMMEEVPPVMR